MTTPDHLDDEQLTALADGDGSADDRAHLLSCERCRARSDALASVAALVAAPPASPSEAAREAAVGAAMREAERPVAPIRSHARRRVPAWLAPAAAVVALLALVAVVVPQLGNGDAGNDAARGRSAAGGQAEGSELSGQADSRAASPVADLGAVDDGATLARRVADALTAAGAADAAEAQAPGGAPCGAAFAAAAAAASPPLGPLRLRASLVWEGQPAEVGSDGRRAVVLATPGCATLATVDLP